MTALSASDLEINMPRTESGAVLVTIDEEEKEERNPLKRTGRLFGGMLDDLKQRMPEYKSDFIDARRFQTFSSIVFIFFANFAPAITFGGLMGSYTNDKMGITETLMAQAICGLVWAFFSAQPLLVLSATGPVLIFEASLFKFCDQLGYDFLAIRIWTGVWLLLISVVIVMFDLAVLLKRVTRFTEEIFATLISAIFITKSINFLRKTFKANPVEDLLYYWLNFQSCLNATNQTELISAAQFTDYLDNRRKNYGQVVAMNEMSENERDCFKKNQPDTALMTIILMFGTLVFAYLLKKFRESRFLGRKAREAIGDFGLLIAIIVTNVLDYIIFDRDYLERIDMPSDITSYALPASRNGSSAWILPSDCWSGYIFAALPAILLSILLFVETGITEILLLKTERKLMKGGGIHWDILLLGFLTLLCSFLGIPWMCAAGAQSLAHSNSLTVRKPNIHSKTPVVHHVIEQRVTAIVVALLLGACAFAGKFLRFMPLAVPFGVFLYLGIIDIFEMEFSDRVLLFFVPAKYFPDDAYCQKVKPRKIHLFTIIQILCVVVVYCVKINKFAALFFPLVEVLACVLRSHVLPLIFEESDLSALDDHSEDSQECDNEVVTGGNLVMRRSRASILVRRRIERLNSKVD